VNGIQVRGALGRVKGATIKKGRLRCDELKRNQASVRERKTKDYYKKYIEIWGPSVKKRTQRVGLSQGKRGTKKVTMKRVYVKPYQQPQREKTETEKKPGNIDKAYLSFCADPSDLPRGGSV